MLGHFQLDVREQTDVQDITPPLKDGEKVQIKTDKGDFSCHFVVWASGSAHQSTIPETAHTDATRMDQVAQQGGDAARQVSVAAWHPSGFHADASCNIDDVIAFRLVGSFTIRRAFRTLYELVTVRVGTAA